jgi:hypothetical protein
MTRGEQPGVHVLNTERFISVDAEMEAKLLPQGTPTVDREPAPRLGERPVAKIIS